MLSSLPIRILQVIGSSDLGGVECWLLETLSRLDPEAFQTTVVVGSTGIGAAEAALRSSSAKLVKPLSRSLLAFARQLRSEMHNEGPYDIVHSHIGPLSGLVLRMAQQEGIPVRIAHSRNTRRRLSSRSMARQVLAALGYRMINSAATHLLGISKDAAVALFGEGCLSDPRLRIMPPAISLDPFRSRPDKAQVRAQLGLPVHAPVIGHVGRFAPQKNHRFLLKVAALVVAQRPETRVLLVGAGALRGEIENRSRTLGIADNVVFAGERQDVPAVMMAGMDVLLFPSRWEGLGRVIVEAQAAGLPCIISDVVPREADAVPALITRMSLSDPAEVWAERVLAALDAGPTVTQEEALGAIKDSPLNIERNVRDLERLYTEAVATVRRSQAREGGEPEGAG